MLVSPVHPQIPTTPPRKRAVLHDKPPSEAAQSGARCRTWNMTHQLRPETVESTALRRSGTTSRLDRTRHKVVTSKNTQVTHECWSLRKGTQPPEQRQQRQLDHLPRPSEKSLLNRNARLAPLTARNWATQTQERLVHDGPKTGTNAWFRHGHTHQLISLWAAHELARLNNSNVSTITLAHLHTGCMFNDPSCPDTQ